MSFVGLWPSYSRNHENCLSGIPRGLVLSRNFERTFNAFVSKTLEYMVIVCVWWPGQAARIGVPYGAMPRSTRARSSFRKQWLTCRPLPRYAKFVMNTTPCGAYAFLLGSRLSVMPSRCEFGHVMALVFVQCMVFGSEAIRSCIVDYLFTIVWLLTSRTLAVNTGKRAPDVLHRRL